MTSFVKDLHVPLQTQKQQNMVITHMNASVQYVSTYQKYHYLVPLIHWLYEYSVLAVLYRYCKMSCVPAC